MRRRGRATETDGPPPHSFNTPVLFTHMHMYVSGQNHRLFFGGEFACSHYVEYIHSVTKGGECSVEMEQAVVYCSQMHSCVQMFVFKLNIL